MARCLVTGHKGYIGSKVYETLKMMGHEVMGIDLKSGGDILRELKPANDGNFHRHWQNFNPEYIFHLAAIPRVAYSVEHPIEVIENNVLSSLYVLEFARKVGAKRVIYSSSSSVRGNGDGPTSPYAASKYMPESMCKVWTSLYGVDTVCLRYFNVYSPCQEAEGPYATAIANFMRHIRQSEDPFITGDGEQRRDMANVRDVVSANLFCMNHDGNFNGDCFDVGTGENITLNAIKDIVLEYFPETNFVYKEPRAGDVMYTKADMKKLEKVGWRPKVSIQKGIHSCFKNLKKELDNE
jgi:UDP-glucose 4-epimerase